MIMLSRLNIREEVLMWFPHINNCDKLSHPAPPPWWWWSMSSSQSFCYSKESGSTRTSHKPSDWSLPSPTLRSASPSKWWTPAQSHSNPSCTLSLDVSSTITWDHLGSREYPVMLCRVSCAECSGKYRKKRNIFLSRYLTFFIFCIL